jgi:Flp pilus assembly pilin Flp
MRILRLSKSRRGSAGITYGLTVGLVAVVAVTAVQQLGGAISGLSNSAAGSIGAATSGMMAKCQPSTYTATNQNRQTVTASPAPTPETASGVAVTISFIDAARSTRSGDAFCIDGAWQPVEIINSYGDLMTFTAS